MSTEENKLISEIIDAIKYYQESNVDIPFIIAPIHEAIIQKKCNYLIADTFLNKHSIYYIDVEESNDGIHTIIIEFDDLPYRYLIECSTEGRYWGFCECTPDMNDYREDKGCCGHGCDWEAPRIQIKKVYDMTLHSWTGDEHSYWEFEDEYYKKDKALKEEKDLQYKEDRKKYLEKEISKMAAELETLY